jgi:hypothetical protein
VHYLLLSGVFVPEGLVSEGLVVFPEGMVPVLELLVELAPSGTVMLSVSCGPRGLWSLPASMTVIVCCPAVSSWKLSFVAVVAITGPLSSL